jgi:hypothetical protein
VAEYRHSHAQKFHRARLTASNAAARGADGSHQTDVPFHVVFSELEIGLMKPTAIVLNTARGKVVDEAARANAMTAGRVRTAASLPSRKSRCPGIHRCASSETRC